MRCTEMDSSKQGPRPRKDIQQPAKLTESATESATRACNMQTPDTGQTFPRVPRQRTVPCTRFRNRSLTGSVLQGGPKQSTPRLGSIVSFPNEQSQWAGVGTGLPMWRDPYGPIGPSCDSCEALASTSFVTLQVGRPEQLKATA